MQHVQSEKHEISDHNVVEIFIPNSELSAPPNQFSTPLKPELQGFNALDLSRANFENISADLNEVDWDALWSNSTLDNFPKVLQTTVLNICKKHTPIKCLSGKKSPSHKRAYHSVSRKKRKLKTRLDCLKTLYPTSPKIITLEKEVELLHEELKSLTFNNQFEKERKAIEKIKLKPKYFYSYAKKFAKTKHSISQLITGENDVLTKRKDIADALQDQFCSSFSDPCDTAKKVPIDQTDTDIPSKYHFHN